MRVPRGNKRFIVEASETQTEVVPAFFGPARFIQNGFTEEVRKLVESDTPQLERMRIEGAAMRRGALEGDIETGMMIGGQGIGRIKEILPAAEIVRGSPRRPKRRSRASPPSGPAIRCVPEEARNDVSRQYTGEWVVSSLLTERAERFGSEIAIASEEGALTYADLVDRAARVAGALAALGVEPGDRVATMLPTGNDYLAAWHAVVWLGAIEVPVNVEYRGSFLEHILRDSGATVLVVHENWLGRISARSRATGRPPRRGRRRPAKRAHDPPPP